MCSAGFLSAQSFISPTLSDQFLANVTTYDAASASASSSEDDVTINCDMLNDGSGNAIKAIAWDEGSASFQAHLYFEDGQGNDVFLQFDGVHPDIVLGNGENGAYRAAVVYIAGIYPVIDFYTLTGLGTTSFAATYTGTVQLSTNSVGSVSGSSDIPHIDMWSDNTAGAQVNGLPGMWDFVVTWEEGLLGDINYNWGNIVSETMYDVSPGRQVNIAVPASGRKFTDVACYTNLSTNTRWAAFTYVDGVNVDVAEMNFTGATPPSPLPALSTPINYGVGVTNNFLPRIEAMSQWDPSSFAIPWQMVVSHGSACYEYNTVTTGSDISTSLLWTGNFKSTAIAAGLGYTGNEPNLGNAQYTLGYLEWTGNPAPPLTFPINYYARGINAATGLLTDPDYYVINTGIVYGMNNYYFADVSKSLALSNCSNSGDYLLSVWYDGDDVSATGSIWYKLSGNSSPMQFKMGAVATVDGSAKLYPNPAKDRIFLSNTRGVYNVYDFVGRNVLSGTLGTDGIEISALPAGLYMLKIGGEAYKFTKQ